jgi:hypothetical protein
MPRQGQVRNARVRCLHASAADLDAASVGDAWEVALKLEHFELRLKLHTGERGPEKNRVSVQSPNITLLVTWGRGQPRQDQGVKSSRFGSQVQQRFVLARLNVGAFVCRLQIQGKDTYRSISSIEERSRQPGSVRRDPMRMHLCAMALGGRSLC